MIIEALVRLYEALAKQGKITKDGWGKEKIRFALCINRSGELEDVMPLQEPEEGKKTKPIMMEVPTPINRRTNQIEGSTRFLWDNSSYMLGVDNKGKPDRSEKCFRENQAYHHMLLDDVNCEVAKSVLAFFDKWNPAGAEENPALAQYMEEIKDGCNLVFRVGDVFAHEDESIQDAWQTFYENQGEEHQQCLVTGETQAIQRVHPALKGAGLPGTLATGWSLVSFNCPAFCSYGNTQGFNSPIGRHAAFAYTTALDYLLVQNKENVQRIGNTTIVCWAEDDEPQYQQFAMEAIAGKTSEDTSEDDILKTIKRLAKGLYVEEKNLDPNRKFYILGLSGNRGRGAVQFFYHNSFGKLMENVNAHYERLEIERAPYERAALPLWALLNETVSQKSKETPSPSVTAATARAIFEGVNYPATLLIQTIARIHAERDVSRGKAAIIKAYYLKNPNSDCPKEVLTVALNEESTNPAYNLGRLFSVYEAIQNAANPNINSTIKDKYFTSAAANPAVIFPLLDNLCQHHLRKLEIPQRIWFENQIFDIVNVMGETYPTRLNLPQQGAFNLGYYHQTRKRFTKKEDKE